MANYNKNTVAAFFNFEGDSRQAENFVKYTLSRKKLPPYGKLAQPINGRQLSIVYGWPKGTPRQDVLVLPDDRPENYQWPVRDLDIFVTASANQIPQSVAQNLAEVLVAAGAVSVVIFGTQKSESGKLSGLLFWPETLVLGGES